MSEAIHYAPTPLPRRRLWLGLLLAPAAWTTAFTFGYVLVARSCEGDNGMHATGLAGARWIDLAVALAMSVVAAWGLATARACVRDARSTPAPDDRQAEIAAGAIDAEARGTVPWWGRELLMARAGVIGSTLFLGGTLLFAIAPLLLNACNQAH